MPALPPQIEPCFACLGMSMADALRLGLWQSISENIEPVATPIIFKTGVPVSHTGNTSETTLYSQLLPALGSSAVIEVRGGFTFVGGAGTRTIRFKLDGVEIMSAAVPLSNNGFTVDRTVWNRGATNSQVVHHVTATVQSYTSAIATPQTFTIETNAGVIFSITAQLANAADTARFDGVLIIIWP